MTVVQLKREELWWKKLAYIKHKTFIWESGPMDVRMFFINEFRNTVTSFVNSLKYKWCTFTIQYHFFGHSYASCADLDSNPQPCERLGFVIGGLPARSQISRYLIMYSSYIPDTAHWPIISNHFPVNQRRLISCNTSVMTTSGP